MTDEVFGSFEVTVEIPESTIRGLLCSAFEGGSNYWYNDLHIDKLPEGDSRDDYREGGRRQIEGTYWHWSQLVPLVEGGRIAFDDTEGGKKRYLGLTQLALGLKAMSVKYPYHFSNVANPKNMDGRTGDVFLQCCIFGRIEYE